MMADLCIVCEAFLQPCEDFLLCDGCRKPAETSIDEESPIGEGVEETPLHPEYTHRFQKKIQTEDRRITRVKRSAFAIKSRAPKKRDVAVEPVKPVSVIVKEILLKKLTETSRHSLPWLEYLVRTQNRFS